MIKTLLIPQKEMRIERLISELIKTCGQSDRVVNQGGWKEGGEKSVNFAIL